MKLPFLLAAVLGFGAPGVYAQTGGVLSPKTSAKPPASLSPAQQVEKQVRAFVDNLNEVDHSQDAVETMLAAQKQILGAKRGWFGANVWAEDFLDNYPFLAKIQSISPPQMNGERATVTVKYRLELKKDMGDFVSAEMKPLQGREQSETLQLQLAPSSPFTDDETWQIVAPELEPQGEKEGQPPLLQFFEFKVAQKPVSGKNLSAEKSLANLRKLGEAVLSLTEDFDGQIAFAPEYVQPALYLSIVDQSDFFVPGTYEPYTFNGNLSGHYIKSENTDSEQLIGGPAVPYLDNTEKLVMFYEGHDEKPIFRYNGKAAICFADGKAALVSPDEAKNLVWNP